MVPDRQTVCQTRYIRAKAGKGSPKIEPMAHSKGCLVYLAMVTHMIEATQLMTPYEDGQPFLEMSRVKTAHGRNVHERETLDVKVEALNNDRVKPVQTAVWNVETARSARGRQC